jgi:sugar lactone lactonase YvrE
VADAQNNAIRKVAPDGTTTTLAGGQIGATDGAGTNASFNGPSGVAVDGFANVYVADEFNHTIRKILPDGTVTTLAGMAGSSGTADGAGSSARFNHPSGLAIDEGGNLYVADIVNSLLRVVSPEGMVSTLAVLPPYPAGIAVDNEANVYVADTGYSVIFKIVPGGAVSTLAGLARVPGASDGIGTNALFSFPAGIAADSAGNVLVADTGNNTIRRIGTDGMVTTLAGQPGRVGATDGAWANALFSQPWGIVADPAGNIYVAESGNNSIRAINPDGRVLTLAGPGGSTGSDSGPGRLARFNHPAGVAVDTQGNLLVADWLNFLVRMIAPDGTVSDVAGQAGVAGANDGAATNAHFASPIGVAVDTLGNVYVVDPDNSTIRRIYPGGNVVTFAGQSTGQPGNVDGPAALAFFNTPSGVAVDIANNVYVADTGNQTIRMIGTGGQVTTLAGLGSVAGYQDGVGTNAMFSGPSAVAVDGAGNVYVADSGNHAIREIAPDGVVTTVAGNAAVAGSTDGIGTNATFSNMAGLAVDKSGNIYVADTYNDTIRMISTNGTVTTIGGFPGLPGRSDGTGANALFSQPTGIAVDASGIIYVADSMNNTIRVGVPPLGVPPELQIAGWPGEVVLSWSSTSAGFVLQQTESLGTGVTWITITNSISLIGGQFILTNPTTGSETFYRLINH